VIAAAAKVGRNGQRDQVLLRLMYRHALRAGEARQVRWTDFDLDIGRTFHVRRLKGSSDSLHTLDRDEVAALRKLRDISDSHFVFTSERGGRISPDMIAGSELLKRDHIRSLSGLFPSGFSVCRRR